jgi:circadian clock protein KaiC
VGGAPGIVATTVALQFLLEGVRSSENGVYHTLSITERELRDGAASHGWKLDYGIEVRQLIVMFGWCAACENVISKRRSCITR